MTTLHAEARSCHGTRPAFNLRRDGRLPAVVYGEGGETVAITIEAHAFENLLRHHERVLDIELGGKVQQVLVHELQWDHLGDHLMHVDFLRASHGKQVEVEVVLEFVGHPKGTPRGEFVKNLQELQIRCTPRSIPEHIAVHIHDLDVGDSLHVRDLEMPEGVACLDEPDTLVCGVHARVEAEEGAEEGARDSEASAEPEVIGKGKGESEPGGDE